ncbi:hypothetical protein O6H91_Y509800 [Diphasiastrum complanatum]|nr:hypothetical protein O6H91_Y509800 [Diphasiastrum complanatum]
MHKGLSYGCIRNDTLGGCKANQIAFAPRTENCVGCKRCESTCPTDFLSVRVDLGSETTRSTGLAY